MFSKGLNSNNVRGSFNHVSPAVQHTITIDNRQSAGVVCSGETGGWIVPKTAVCWPLTLSMLFCVICLPTEEAQETQVQCLCREDPLEEGTASHSSILAWEIPRTEEPGGLRSTGSQRVGHDWVAERGSAALQTVRNSDGKEFLCLVYWFNMISDLLVYDLSCFNPLIYDKDNTK